VLSWFSLGQLGFALLVVGLVAERAYVLAWRSALSEEATRWLMRQLERADRSQLVRFCQQRPQAQLAQVVLCALDADAESELPELLLSLREQSLARLRLLRVSATLASTLGLLGGILTLAGVFGAPNDLSALKAGGAQRLTLSHALTTMAIGVATSAFCFQALAVLRPIAERQLASAQRAAREASAAPAREVHALDATDRR
jgi:hypothetical protein